MAAMRREMTTEGQVPQTPDEKIRARLFAKLKYHDPEYVLRGFLKVDLSLPLHRLPRAVRELRTRNLREHQFARQAALFTYGLSLALKRSLRFALHEADDHDAVLACRDGQVVEFNPLQLKELVPEHVNQRATFENVLRGLEKYADARDLFVAVYMNRDLKGFNFREIDTSRLRLAGLFLFGSVDPDGRRFLLVGDLTNPPNSRTAFPFDHPEPLESLP